MAKKPSPKPKAAKAKVLPGPPIAPPEASAATGTGLDSLAAVLEPPPAAPRATAPPAETRLRLAASQGHPHRARIERELVAVQKEMLVANRETVRYGLLYVVQQALVWAMDPDQFKAPLQTVVEGLDGAAAPRGC